MTARTSFTGTFCRIRHPNEFRYIHCYNWHKMLTDKMSNLSDPTNIAHIQAGTLMVYVNSSRVEVMRARPDGASICDTKPLATAWLDMRGTLIFHANISGPIHNPRVGAETRSISQDMRFFIFQSLFRRLKEKSHAEDA